MLYPKNALPFSRELFKNPTSEYRAAPFWAWNNKLDPIELKRQIEVFKMMGFGGFHMHVRTGMATEYLSDEYMEAIKDCVDKARDESMLAWLYDEDRWPSGAAGGLVTKDPKYRALHLLLTRRPYGSAVENNDWKDASLAQRSENGKLLTCFDIELSIDGHLISYKKVDEGDCVKGFKLYVYEETSPPSPWYNNQTYLNTLDKASVAEFIRVTYERYNETVSDDFGGVIPAIFTDEPQFPHKEALAFAHEEKDVILPWTYDLTETYHKTYDNDLLDNIPELLWDLPDGKISVTRYRYHDHVAERFASAFADQCGRWCQEHGILLTGHMMEEPTLKSQTAALGETMRSYRSFQLPGIDMLCDWREYTTAKQAQSAARQYGRSGVLSELYGVTNYDFDFRGHKLQGDWQAALGVSVRVPHLSWVSMNGEAKRDYPQTFNYQSPWHEEYPYIEDHYARINTAMTRGKAVCKVGVIHPVESYWLHWGAQDITASVRDHKDADFKNLTEWLLRGCIDFDFISESLLPEQNNLPEISKDGFAVGEMKYDAVIVPNMETIRKTTLQRLEAYTDAGGSVMILGAIPSLVDAAPSDAVKTASKKFKHVPLERLHILRALDHLRDVEIRSSDGTVTDNLFYQLRRDEDHLWLFIAQADKPENPDIPVGDLKRILIKGEFTVTLYDTMTGETKVLNSEIKRGHTVLYYPVYEHDSILLRLDKDPSGESGHQADMVQIHKSEPVVFLQPVPVTLHEPNVLLLDMAEYALDDAPYRPTEEILRLDNKLRKELGWPLRGTRAAQPWVEFDTSKPHTLRLRFTIHSDIDIQNPVLALENAEITKVTLNGVDAGKINGWYVDKSISKISLPEINTGKNILELSIPYGKKIDIESCYLLGDFGVIVQGCNCKLTEPVKELCFGDITRQGLPFYGGNITYHLDMDTAGNPLDIAVPHYRGHLLRAVVDGKDAGVIAFSPYRLRTGDLSPGRHRIDLKYYGSRINTFGQLHRNDRHHPWWGPDSWRTTGDSWSYEYRFWEQGIIKSPEIW